MIDSDEARPQEIEFLDGKGVYMKSICDLNIILIYPDIKLDLIRRRHRQRNEAQTSFDRLLRLDSFTRPGLTEDEFRGFLTQCNGCELIMTRRMFERHNCVGKVKRRDMEVIDLTAEHD